MPETSDIELSRELNVLIAIQARTNSTRFPQKIYQTIGKKMVLEHVIDQALSAKFYLERPSSRSSVNCKVAVLHPETDVQLFSTFRKTGAILIGGDEHDVLSRYITAQRLTKADYIVRLTSDCPLILDFMISKHVNVAIRNDLDYVSNVEESVRMVFDGMDTEIISKKALSWLAENATAPEDREHVTLLIRKLKPVELRQGFISSKLDSSNLKLSLDTPEDLERIRKYYHQREDKMELATKLFGKRNVYEI